MSYRPSYLNSEHWEAFRRLYFAKNKPKVCDFCKANKKLDLHHVTYERIGRERLDDVVAICRSCHDEIHALFDLNRKKGLQSATDRIRSKYSNSKSVKPIKPKGKKRRLDYRRASEKRQEINASFEYAIQNDRD
jgi:hypothetical protein